MDHRHICSAHTIFLYRLILCKLGLFQCLNVRKYFCLTQVNYPYISINDQRIKEEHYMYCTYTNIYQQEIFLFFSFTYAISSLWSCYCNFIFYLTVCLECCFSIFWVYFNISKIFCYFQNSWIKLYQQFFSF